MTNGTAAAMEGLLVVALVLMLIVAAAVRWRGGVGSPGLAVRAAVLGIDLLLLLGAVAPAEPLLELRGWLTELAELLVLLERAAAAADNKLDTRGDAAYNDAESSSDSRDRTRARVS